MSEPTPTPAEPKPLPAPTFAELGEFAATALVNAPGVFARLAARPTPRTATSLLLAVGFGTLYFVLNLTRVALADPAMLAAYAPWQIGIVAFFGLGLWTSLVLLGASFIYGLGRALGCEGDFDRAMLVVAFVLATAPVQALCAWFPMAWMLPTVLAAWIAATGLTAMFKTNAWAARGVCAVIAGFVLAAQYGTGIVIERYAGAARLAASAAAAAPSSAELAELQQQLEQMQAVPESTATAAPSAPGQSSLDLLRGPAEESAPAAAPTTQQQLDQLNAQGDAMNKSVLTMLDGLEPMLNNPIITKNMTLQQKSDYTELKQLIRGLRTGIASNTITSPQEQQAKMMHIQKLVMRMMSGAGTPPQAAPPGTKK